MTQTARIFHVRRFVVPAILSALLCGPATLAAQPSTQKPAGLAKVDSHVVAYPKSKRVTTATKRAPVGTAVRVEPVKPVATAPRVTIKPKPATRVPR
ncbi:MAG: hypothetical protein IT353_08785 [Gemmatimonadaceae bacterium]|nr:hypothetical protein [Gemmatimonadaceae bacterium]